MTVNGQVKPKGYKLIFGIDTFKTATVVKKDPLDKKSLREYSFLFKNERQVIKIPRRIDRITTINRSSKRGVRIDTVDQIIVTKVVDTISKSQLDEIINSEIQIYSGTIKLMFDEAQFEAIQSNGKSSYTIDLQKTKIKDGSHAFQKISGLDKGGYLILDTIWFYDLKDIRHEIECNIAWLIK